jgi:hypothetical protein
VANLPVLPFQEPTLNGTQINGDGTYSYSQYSSP